MLPMVTLVNATLAISLVGRAADSKAPLEPWRMALRRPASLMITHGVLPCLGFLRVRVRGAAAPSSVAPLVVCNHMCFAEGARGAM